MTFAAVQLGIALLATAMCYLPLFYAIVPLSIMLPIYAFNPNLTITEITKLSFNLGNKNWLIIFGLMFVAGILATLVGLILCGIGIYFTASFGLLIQYFVYKDTIGFNTEDDNVPQIEA